jgi:hypothetical protein
MPAWLLSLLSLFAKPVVAWSLQFLETKYPGLKPVIDQILKWLEGQTAFGNTQAVQTLAVHVDKLCSGVACPPELKNS